MNYLNKEKLDLGFTLFFISILVLSRPIFFTDLPIWNILYSLIPIILLSYFWLFHSEKFLLNFFITFISFFILIDLKPWFFQFESHWITASLAILTSFSFTYLYKQAKKLDPLEGTFLNILIKRFPNTNLFIIFCLDTLTMGCVKIYV